LLPAPTPVIERTFPERFVRDAAGRLVSVDARPISIARDLSERLDNSVTLSLAPGAGKGEGAAGALAPNPWQFSLSINHGWLLRSELLIRAGLPAIDRLGGDTAQSRHSVGFQLVAARSGLGMTLDGNWQSGFRLRDPDAVGGARDYRHKAVTIMNLRLFAEPGRLLRTAEKPAWLSELNVSIDIQNLFDTYRRVTLGDGRVPAGYERYEVDPLGRTIQLSVRKRF
jgi:outer membrane receptor protein involved in Fe transport